MQAMGFFSWVGLWIRGRHPRFAGWNLGVVLVLGIATFGLMAQAANLGGEIRHPEIQNVQNVPIDDSAQTLAASWGLFVMDHSWVWPACETLHFVGLCQLFGVVLIGNLRMLGVGKALLSFPDLYQLLPLGMLGFTLNLITGMMFFVAMPEQYTGLFFLLKMSLVGAGALNLPGAVGSYASTPDTLANSVTGDLDLRAWIAPTDWTPAALQEIIDKSASDSSQFSYLLRLNTDGTLNLYWSTNGTTLSSVTSTAAVSAVDRPRMPASANRVSHSAWPKTFNMTSLPRAVVRSPGRGMPARERAFRRFFAGRSPRQFEPKRVWWSRSMSVLEIQVPAKAGS
jgi:hypothetical protein